MSEEKETQEVQAPAKGEEEKQTTETPSGKKSPLEEAKEVRDQMRAENDRREAIIKREEEMYARNMLAGRTDAGDRNLTPEQMQKAEAQKAADEISSAFRT